MSTYPNDLPSPEEILRHEDALDEVFRQSQPPQLEGWPEPSAEPIAINPSTERQAFAELLALFAAEDDGDGETEVTALTLDDFDAESIPAAETDHPPVMTDEEYQP